MCGHVVAQETRALGEAHAFVLDGEIFENERNTGERAVRRTGLRRGARRLEHLGHNGVEARVEPLDALDGGVDELDGAHFSGRDERRLRRRVEERQVVGRGLHVDGHAT